jgi:death-on-curing protein
MLDSAVVQPRASLDGKDLYSGIADKAAALAFSLVMNHPFVDGNKRTGYAAMMMFLSRNGHTIITSIDERESIFVSLAAGTLDRDQFVAWVRARAVRKGVGKPRGKPRRPDRPPAGSG